MPITSNSKTSNLFNIDTVNILLMLGALLVSIKMPFNSFLISYAVLGPLHYLTEIFWLDKQSFYLHQKRDYKWLVFFGIITTLLALYAYTLPFKSPIIIQNFKYLYSASIFIAFIAAISFILFNDNKNKIILISGGILSLFWLFKNQNFNLFFGFFLATFIHVGVFTGLFILLGALKNKSKTGYFSLIIYLLCIISVFIIPINIQAISISALEENSITKSGFASLNATISNFLHGSQSVKFNLHSEISIRIQCLIAFVYTYHYLNWFSKVEIIKWSKVSSSIKLFTLVGWIISVVIYFINYQVGILTLFALSILHVFLEFPLNIISIKSIYSEVKNRI